MKKVLLIFSIMLLMLMAGGMWVVNQCEKPELKDTLRARQTCLAWLMDGSSAPELAKNYCEFKQRNPCYIEDNDSSELLDFINKAYDRCVNKELEDDGFCTEEK